jgi:hypothetical protein
MHYIYAMITGKTLIEMGYKAGPWFPAAIAAANAAAAKGEDVRAAVDAIAPRAVATVGLRPSGDLAHRLNIRAEHPDEEANVAAVEQHMRELMRVPTIVAGAVMPDACPAGAAPGTIPVGGVVAAKDAIHPGMHSADICCSMAVTVFGDARPSDLLDTGMKLSHFGGGGRPRGAQVDPPDDVMAAFEANDFLRPPRAPRSSTSPPRATATTSSMSAGSPRRASSRSSRTTARASRARCSTRAAWRWPSASAGISRPRRRATTRGFRPIPRKP